MFCEMFEPWRWLLSNRDHLALVGYSKVLLLLTSSAAVYTQNFLALVLVGKITIGCSGNWPNSLVAQLELW